MSATRNNGHHVTYDTMLGIVVFAILVAMMAVLAWLSTMGEGGGAIDWYMMP